MRNKFSTLLLVTILAVANTVPTMAQTLYYDGKAHEYNLAPISLYINGEEITTTMPPVELSGRVLVPSREVFEPMGAKVEWDEINKKVKVTYKSDVMILTVNNQTVNLNGQEIPIDVPPKIINDKVMIPVRFISEKLGFNVDWNGSDRSVSIYEVKSPDTDNENNEDNEPDTDSENNENDEPDTEIPQLAEKEYIGSKNVHKIDISDYNNDKANITSVYVNNNKTTISSDTAISGVDILLHAGKVIIDIGNSKSGLASTIMPSNNNYIKSIRTSQFQANTTRVVLDLKAGALVEASLSDDRTSLYIDLSTRTVEKISYDKSDESDTLFFEGISDAQIEVKENNNELQLTIPYSKIENNINWNNLDGDFITAVTAGNDGNNVVVSIDIKKEYSYDVKSDHIGTTIVVGKKNEEPPTEDKLENLSYAGGTRPKIELSNLGQFNVASVKVNDDYRNRTLTFDLGNDYSDKLKNDILNINDQIVKEIKIVNDGTTKLIVKTNVIMSYNINNTVHGVSLEMVKPREKYNKILVIDAGHGGTDSGAVGNGIKEKVINYNQSMELYKALNQKSDIKVYMTRETDVYPTLAFRTDLANEIDAHLFVSIHNNAATSSARGAETLYFPSSTDTTGKRIAQIVQNALVQDCGMINRGIKARSDLYVLKNTRMPAILIETGFISNPLDAAIIRDDAFTKKWADAISDSIIESFNIL